MARLRLTSKAMSTVFDAARFDEIYRRRHENEALNECQTQILGIETADFEVLWRAARLEHFLGMQALERNEKRAARALFESGAQHAKFAENAEFLRVEGAFWRGVCELEAARATGTLAVARVFFAAEKRLERAACLDETYHEGGPARVLGRIFHQKPLILGGSLDRALAFYERALQIAPANSTTLIYQADALLADHQPTAARRALNQILALEARAQWVWETARDQKIAQTWLQTRLD